MKIDWSKAPEGTEGAMVSDFGNNCIKFGCVQFVPRGEWTRQSYIEGPGHWIYIERADDAWEGQGLPPVGIDCQVDLGTHWGHATIVAHHDGGAVAAIHEDDLSYNYRNYDAEYFRPIRTAAQIAAEEREKAVDEMYGLTATSNSPEVVRAQRAACAALYDAGYRKQVAP